MMQRAALAAAACAIGAAASAPSAAAPAERLSLRADGGGAPGAFEIAVGDDPWFRSGNVSVTVGGTTYSQADGSLVPQGASVTASGADLLGAFTSSTQHWNAGATPFTTSSRLYAAGNFVVFNQSFPAGAHGTNITHAVGSSLVSSCFPSFDPRPLGANNGSSGSQRQLGYVWWGGRAFLEGSVGGTWQGDNRGDGPGVGTGDGGGPFVVFEEGMEESLVFSPASNFMINTPGMSARPGVAGSPDDGTLPAPGAAAVVGTAGAGRGYEVFPTSYCSASADGANVSFKGEKFTVAECRAKCDSMKCACFDISATDPKGECRCNMQGPPAGSKNTTKSANGLEAFVFCGDDSATCGGPAPPPIPPPPAPLPPAPKATSDGSLCFGLDAPVESVAAGASLASIVFLGSGVNSAMRDWGRLMLRMYGTERPEDYTTQYLGFSTDNGAYYYYGWNQTTADGGHLNYQDALLGVHAYAAKEEIPYKHILLDSWWYTKGDGGGLKEWDATNDTFPDGLKTFAEKTDWKYQMHNRYWSDNNVYSTENGGKYKFLTEPSNPATNGTQNPQDDLIANKTDAGIPLAVYEQDWLYTEWQGLAGVRASPTIARQWLIQMGAGAAKRNATVQYCMALSRTVLQTLEVPAVTTFRASDDYHPGQTGYYDGPPAGSNPRVATKGCTFPYCVYYQGTSAIIAYALDLKPSKDNYWSTTARQPGSFCDRGGCQEPYSEMQGAISAYTTAQVAPSDGVGFSNASLIKMACRSDGRLLQPSAPARAIDASFALSGAPQPRVEHVHAIMATHTQLKDMLWAHVLVIGLNATFELHPAHLTGELSGDETQEHLVWSGYQASGTVGKAVAGTAADTAAAATPAKANVTIVGPFSPSAPLRIPACGYADFGLYHIAPVFKKTGRAFLGEVGKWVPVSSARVTVVSDAAAAMTVEIVGEVAEQVELVFAQRGEGEASASVGPVSVLCKIGASGKAKASFDGATAKCA